MNALLEPLLIVRLGDLRSASVGILSDKERPETDFRNSQLASQCVTTPSQEVLRHEAERLKQRGQTPH